jgi:hypothetical protein
LWGCSTMFLYSLIGFGALTVLAVSRSILAVIQGKPFGTRLLFAFLTFAVTALSLLGVMAERKAEGLPTFFDMNKEEPVVEKKEIPPATFARGEYLIRKDSPSGAVKRMVTSESPSLSVTPRAFAAEFNRVAEQIGLEARLTEPQVVNGEFVWMTADHIGIYGQVHPESERIVALLMIGEGDGTTKAAQEARLVMQAIVGASQPKKFSQAERERVLEELGLWPKPEPEALKMTVRGEVRYSFRSTKEVGWVFYTSLVHGDGLEETK